MPKKPPQGEHAVAVGPEAKSPESLAALLDGIPPLTVRAEWFTSDAKYKRIRLPKPYRDALKCFVVSLRCCASGRRTASKARGATAQAPAARYFLCFHPEGCLSLVPRTLSNILRQEIAQEQGDRDKPHQLLHLEELQQEAAFDAKERLRISRVLTDAAGIQDKVIVGHRRWRINIWGKQAFEQRLNNPPVSHIANDSSGESPTKPASPGTPD